MRLLLLLLEYPVDAIFVLGHNFLDSPCGGRVVLESHTYFLESENN
jgi:hypothetical protein